MAHNKFTKGLEIIGKGLGGAILGGFGADYNDASFRRNYRRSKREIEEEKALGIDKEQRRIQNESLWSQKYSNSSSREELKRMQLQIKKEDAKRKLELFQLEDALAKKVEQLLSKQTKEQVVAQNSPAAPVQRNYTALRTTLKTMNRNVLETKFLTFNVLQSIKRLEKAIGEMGPGGSTPTSSGGGGYSLPNVGRGGGLFKGLGGAGRSLLKGGLIGGALYGTGRWAIDKAMPVTPEQENYHSTFNTLKRLLTWDYGKKSKAPKNAPVQITPQVSRQAQAQGLSPTEATLLELGKRSIFKGSSASGDVPAAAAGGAFTPRDSSGLAGQIAGGIRQRNQNNSATPNAPTQQQAPSRQTQTPVPGAPSRAGGMTPQQNLNPGTFGAPPWAGGFTQQQQQQQQQQSRPNYSQLSDNAFIGTGPNGRQTLADKAAISRTQVQHQLELEARRLNIPIKDAKIMAASIAGQANRESSYNPLAKHDKDASGNYTGLGLYGHRLERRDAALKWMKENNYSENSMEGWNRFAAYEMMNNPRFRKLRDHLVQSNDLGDSVNRVAKIWEAPAARELDPNSQSMRNRHEGANWALREPTPNSRNTVAGGTLRSQSTITPTQLPSMITNPALGGAAGNVIEAQGQLARTRKNPLATDVRGAISYAAAQAGVQAEVYSGGQAPIGSGGPRVGSTRHDNGNAADVKFFVMENGQKRYLDMRNEQDAARLQTIVKSARQAGMTGIGMGMGYMGPNSMHIGKGREATWGGAPPWFRQAFDEGAQAPKVNPLAYSGNNNVAQATEQQRLGVGSGNPLIPGGRTSPNAIPNLTPEQTRKLANPNLMPNPLTPLPTPAQVAAQQNTNAPQAAPVAPRIAEELMPDGTWRKFDWNKEYGPVAQQNSGLQTTPKPESVNMGYSAPQKQMQMPQSPPPVAPPASHYGNLPSKPEPPREPQSQSQAKAGFKGLSYVAPDAAYVMPAGYGI